MIDPDNDYDLAEEQAIIADLEHIDRLRAENRSLRFHVLILIRCILNHERQGGQEVRMAEAARMATNAHPDLLR